MARNILLFTSTFPRSQDDPLTPRFVYHLGRELLRRHNVHVLAPHAPGAAMEDELDGMRVIRFPYFFPQNCQQLAYGTGMTNNLRQHPSAWLQVPSFFYCQNRALAETVRRFNIEIVNSHWMVPQGLTAAWSARALGVRHLLTVHSAGLFLLRRIPAGRFLARRILKNTDSLFIVSQNNKRLLEDLVRRPVAAQVLPMGIDTGYYGEARDATALRKTLDLPETGPLVLFVGKLSRIKGVKFLLDGFPEVLKNAPDARLVVVGSGPEASSLEEHTRRLQLESRVVFAGQKNQREVRDYLQACDLLTIPSIQDTNGQVEGFPVVMLEALASGKPVVGTRLGGTAEGIVDGETGYLVPPENPGALAAAILRTLEQGPATFADHARQSVRQYDWRAIGEAYSRAFDAL